MNIKREDTKIKKSPLYIILNTILFSFGFPLNNNLKRIIHVEKTRKVDKIPLGELDEVELDFLCKNKHLKDDQINFIINSPLVTLNGLRWLIENKKLSQLQNNRLIARVKKTEPKSLIMNNHKMAIISAITTGRIIPRERL